MAQMKTLNMITFFVIVVLLTLAHYLINVTVYFLKAGIYSLQSFCRYVVRAKAGKKQSAKDATGKAANSAGASLRRHNELALKKVINDGLICKTFVHMSGFCSAASFSL